MLNHYFLCLLFYSDADYWKDIAKKELDKTLGVLKSLNTKQAKNVIIFIGDGMSLPTVTSARIYKAQYEASQAGKKVNGEESLLTFETFPNVGLSKARFLSDSSLMFRFNYFFHSLL